MLPAIAHPGLVVAVLVAIVVLGLIVELSTRRARRSRKRRPSPPDQR